MADNVSSLSHGGGGVSYRLRPLLDAGKPLPLDAGLVLEQVGLVGLAVGNTLVVGELLWVVWERLALGRHVAGVAVAASCCVVQVVVGVKSRKQLKARFLKRAALSAALMHDTPVQLRELYFPGNFTLRTSQKEGTRTFSIVKFSL